MHEPAVGQLCLHGNLSHECSSMSREGASILLNMLELAAIIL
jgi:hypothetical protein